MTLNNNPREAATEKYLIRPEQSVPLLQALHILTRDGKLNQDSRRKLKQVYHLVNFIEPLLKLEGAKHADLTLVDHGAGKSYLGFILYDLFFKTHAPNGKIVGIETRDDLVEKSAALAKSFGFAGMEFRNISSKDAKFAPQVLRELHRIDVVTALHACNTATDDAIAFGLAHHAQHIVLVPCCQAEVAATLRENKSKSTPARAMGSLWKHPIHAREFGSHATNVLRCLQLESHSYKVTVTELVGWEHSLKNELIIASKNPSAPKRNAEMSANVLQSMLDEMGLVALRDRFFVPTEYRA